MTHDERKTALAALVANGLTFADCVPAFASEAGNPHVEAARRLLHRDGEVEIDDGAILSDSTGGQYVMAWIWVSDAEAGVTSTDAAA